MLSFGTNLLCLEREDGLYGGRGVLDHKIHACMHNVPFRLKFKLNLSHHSSVEYLVRVKVLTMRTISPQL